MSDKSRIQDLFNQQMAHYLAVGKTTAKARVQKLRKLEKAVLTYRPAIKEALQADLKKPPVETDAAEIFPITSAIRHTCAHLHRWMQPQEVPTPLSLAGSTSWIRYESRGVCLIISPWNFPFNLSFIPLVSAIAAGNCAIVKPSEHAPRSSALIHEIIAQTFAPEEVAVAEGAVETAQFLLKLPFHHIFFTGSPRVGKIVMKAAADHLASVTLELGGKSPVVVDDTAHVQKAAIHIARGKLANAGQTCIAPDYVLVNEKIYHEFVNALKQAFGAMLGQTAETSDSYARLVHEAHCKRVGQLLEEAVQSGANILYGGKKHEASRFIEPTLIDCVDARATILSEEIFGPLLYLKPFRNLDEAIHFINSGERPLTMSIFSKNKNNINRLLDETRTGGVAINHTQLHFFNHHLPFGGINNSGMGYSHGWHGFAEFSHARAVYRQDVWPVLDLVRAPYGKLQKWLMDITISWL